MLEAFDHEFNSIRRKPTSDSKIASWRALSSTAYAVASAAARGSESSSFQSMGLGADYAH